MTRILQFNTGAMRGEQSRKYPVETTFEWKPENSYMYRSI
jgi:hypothetical protein